jgi:hypothetical protein
MEQIEGILPRPRYNTHLKRRMTFEGNRLFVIMEDEMSGAGQARFLQRTSERSEQNLHSGSRCSPIILCSLDRLRARAIMFPFPSFSLDHEAQVSPEMEHKCDSKLNLS